MLEFVLRLFYNLLPISKSFLLYVFSCISKNEAMSASSASEDRRESLEF